MSYATRDSLLSKRHQRRYAEETVDGQVFRLRSLNALESNTIQARVLVEDDEDDRVREIATVNCRLIAQCVVDGNNDRIFTDEDIDSLAELDSAFIERLAKACRKHTDFDPGAVEKAEKNSNETAS